MAAYFTYSSEKIMNRLDTVIGNSDQFKCEGTKLISFRSEKSIKTK